MEGKSAMEGGIEQIPPSSQLEIMKTAHKYKVDESDPSWILIRLALESVGGVQAITDALKASSGEVVKATTSSINEDLSKARSRIAEDLSHARSEISIAGEAQKTAIARALDSILPIKLAEALSEIEKKVSQEKSSKGLILFIVCVTMIALVISSWVLYGMAEINGEKNMAHKIERAK